MQPFEAAIATLFADPNIAHDAVWRSGGGGVTVCVVIKRPDQIVGFDACHAALKRGLRHFTCFALPKRNLVPQ
ncbi:head-tail joining protein [Methylocystis sp.]|uniref:head-tail joining protein n=1 Tax=Methylocystis sp. TaxID=1911079 RepID=UPI003DA401CB